VNDLQKVYEQTRHITPNTLRWLAVVRGAVADGDVTEDQVQEALAAGADAVGELLESIEEAEEAEGDAEEFSESFNPFGRLV
jgi:thiamine monophosphate synthase